MNLVGLLRLWALPAIALMLLLSMDPAAAHKPSDSYLTVQAREDRIDIRWDIALRDLDYVLQLDRNGNGELSWGEVRQRSADIHRLAVSRLALLAGDKTCEVAEAGPLALDRHSDGTYAVLKLSSPCPGFRNGLVLRYSMLFDVDPTHRGLVQWIGPGTQTPQALVFAVGSSEQPLAMQAPGVLQTLKQYIVEGVWHIWIGFDHILFLLSLLLPAVLVRREGRWEAAPSLRASVVEVVKIVTAFTVAHSITLSLAAVGLVTLPSRLVESVIAASVVFAAVNNLRGTIERRRWVMAFVFGLIHGFGFASVLADLGLPQEALLLALIGFNVGVELGQLAIVLAFVPLAFWLRNTKLYRVGILQAGSVLIALLASWWFVERAFDL